MTTAALIVAAGRGTRLGGELPKQYVMLAGKAVLTHTIGAILPHVDSLRVVIHPDDRALYDAATADFDLPEPIIGGETRAASVRAGLEAMSKTPPEFVLITTPPDPLSALKRSRMFARRCTARQAPARAYLLSMRYGATGLTNRIHATDCCARRPPGICV